MYMHSLILHRQFDNLCTCTIYVDTHVRPVSFLFLPSSPSCRLFSNRLKVNYEEYVNGESCFAYIGSTLASLSAAGNAVLEICVPRVTRRSSTRTGIYDVT